MNLVDMIGDFGTVIKIDVSDLERSAKWYSECLGLTVDDHFNADKWRQMVVPGPGNMAFGLLHNPEGVQEGIKKATFVVIDIEGARSALIDKGVDVEEIVTLDDWVRLAFFRDPDGNVFGLRQNL